MTGGHTEKVARQMRICWQRAPEYGLKIFARVVQVCVKYVYVVSAIIGRTLNFPDSRDSLL